MLKSFFNSSVGRVIFAIFAIWLFFTVDAMWTFQRAKLLTIIAVMCIGFGALIYYKSQREN